MSKLSLFCFPYAGGSSVIFNKWRTCLDDSISLRPVELAGRGRRLNEPFYQSIADAVDDVFNIIKDQVTDHPYLLFGHSMGGAIAYNLAQKFNESNYPPPFHIFFSGKGAPHIKSHEKQYHLMDDGDFRREIINLGGTPPEFFDHEQLLELYLPVLKNDFMIVETAGCDDIIRPLETDISVFLGRNDDMTLEQCNGWKKHSTKDCHIHYFDGGHFFLNDHIPEIVKLINQTAKSCHVYVVK